MEKRDFLQRGIRHIDIRSFNSAPLIEQFGEMSFQARNLARAAKIYDKMLLDKDCTIILCLAGSLFSAGLKKVVYDLIDNNMVDAIVSTGAIIVDQDFFEALGAKHYQGTPLADDNELMEKKIDRIYDTFIDEDDLRVCDMTIAGIADGLPPKPYSSRQFIKAMGEYLVRNKKGKDSVTRRAYEKGVPIFVPAFSDCSAGFGLVYHQWHRKGNPMVSIDSAKDFLELTKIKIASKDSGLFMIGGGVPKNFAQDVPVAADILGKEVSMHKYAVQITVADERDGALSGSTLKEAHSWGKVDEGFEQMVFSEATIAFPLIASYAYHKGSWKARKQMDFNALLDKK
ncbi:MAG: deoxyhypusine synthase [Candidatus Altiarchaeales archaeon IMC4]|nr:MAG: deoxyhypusine synthase [Candidatus Altiarchaeales archaeon IMC4]